ncbi:MAG: ATP12 family protein [Asticcacaulis sp.]
MTYKAEAPSKRTDQIGSKPKRFWKTVEIKAEGEGFGVTLDARSVKTPKGTVLVLPNFALAALVAREWEAVAETVDFTAMPLTRLGFAALDHMADGLEAAEAEAGRFSETDLICYPADYPQALMAREQAAWGPVIDWLKNEMGLEFIQQTSLAQRGQPRETVEGVKAILRSADIYARAGLMAAIPLLGSVALALALYKGRLSADDAFAASRVGEAFQAETWGEDAEASQRAEGMRRDAHSLNIWFRAL